MARDNPFAVDPFQSPNPPLFGTEVRHSALSTRKLLPVGTACGQRACLSARAQKYCLSFSNMATTLKIAPGAQNGHSATVPSVPIGEPE